MVVVTGVVGLCVSVYALGIDLKGREGYGYHALTHILLLGVCGAFLTGDIFNLYVWFEVMLIASFVLLALGGERAQLEGAIKYVTLNLMSSAFFLAAVGILYGVSGSLNMAELSLILASGVGAGLQEAIAMLFMVAFGIKAAVFPLFFWLPASYHTPPAPVSALFAGLLTKVGVYALIRVFTLLFTGDVPYTHGIILVASSLTMATGVLGAAYQTEFRRILSFHIVSQIGYMIMGLGLFTPFALGASVFYMIHHIIVKTNLFLVGGYVNRLTGAYDLKALGGVFRSYPALGLLFLVPALSLSGVPPLSGFWAKLSLVKAGLDSEAFVTVFVALSVSILTLFSMTKIWAEVFWKDAPQGLEFRPVGSRTSLALPIVILAAMTLAIGLWAEPLFRLSMRASEELLNPEGYIKAVLGVGI
jgi:multicomponent Na+:H+ antiporter subunit D